MVMFLTLIFFKTRVTIKIKYLKKKIKKKKKLKQTKERTNEPNLT